MAACNWSRFVWDNFTSQPFGLNLNEAPQKVITTRFSEALEQCIRPLEMGISCEDLVTTFQEVRLRDIYLSSEGMVEIPRLILRPCNLNGNWNLIAITPSKA